MFVTAFFAGIFALGAVLETRTVILERRPVDPGLADWARFVTALERACRG